MEQSYLINIQEHVNDRIASGFAFAKTRHSFTRLLVNPFTRQLVNPFTHLLVNSFTHFRFGSHPFSYYLACLFLCRCLWDRKTFEKYSYSFLFIPIICLFLSCSHHYSTEIEDVLKQAGSNRSELEKVLEHYSQDPADSLKLRAAEFLIINMPGKYSEYYDAPWNDVATVCMQRTSSSDKQMVLDTYRLGEPTVKKDVECITAEYLINNIELSFKVWREQPWGKHIPFDIFCEEILPYRINTEPLENWREKALASFADLNREFQKDSSMTAVKACGKVNDLLPRFRMDKDFPAMNYTMLIASSRGDCSAMVSLAIFAMRALGIPVTYDYTLQWPHANSGHTWNSVCDSSGVHISFMGAQSNPGRWHQGASYIKSKIYRKMFAEQKPLPIPEEHIPSSLRDIYMKDISQEHADCMSVEIPVRFPDTVHTGYAYLATLVDNDGLRWNPIAWGKVEGKTIRYEFVGKKVLYLPIYYVNDRQTPASWPFYLDNEGNIQFFEPDTSVFRETILYESRMIYSTWMANRMKGGRFEGANRRDFSDARVLHTVTKLQTSLNEVRLERPAAYRYVRYVSPPLVHCNVAEIMFYGTNGKKLRGKAIGTPGSWGNTMLTFDKAFDGHLATFYDAPQRDNAWTGMDFGDTTTIGSIHYYPRRNVKLVDPGKDYELLYWNGIDWQSLGKQHADDLFLSFRIPDNALFYIRPVNEKWDILSVFAVRGREQEWLLKDMFIHQ
jgi:hypothetical protein